jgi:hypothetical protein
MGGEENPVGSETLSRLLCWWLHRRHWTIVNRGILPFALDADCFCPICDRGRGHPAKPYLRPHAAGA